MAMASRSSDSAASSSRTSGWVKQRTLVLIRWIAVAGQAVTLCVVHFGMGLTLPIVPALCVVAASALLNVVVGRHRFMRARLSDAQAARYLAYDMLQLTLLLYLTGGLFNPFAVLILAPVVVSATVLSRTSTIALGLLAATSISILAVLHQPLPWAEAPFEPPSFYSLGIWLALVLSTLFIAGYVGSVSEEARRMSAALSATQLALAREQRLASLGALAAAAAHELGSPLATIALASKELARDLDKNSPLREDVELLISQSARCRDILAELGRTPEAEEGGLFARLPLSAIVDSAATPYRSGAIRVVLDAAPAEGAPEDSPEPMVKRSPEIVHGLGNLIQNAVQFAREEVVVRQRWGFDEVSIEVMDDGPGFAPYLLGRLGEPYISSRAASGLHMGLGIFIAQNLLERTGAELAFSNRSEGGARVAMRWRRAVLEANSEEGET
ncbi:MAG TPA: ActS/PrrB/RegB family redox-sensitive histidine kinase [Alphaproteobacteria bacterium]|nr:ActS/PrrB/RegB family redox-sensitive histidine kinase [Alphaproteobacteria bacterium]